MSDAEGIEEPMEVDVLAGRGGLSNHHAGNEWYRRLIKSNRPLYRACPKHTKLLVSKAIVQAVQQQGGRFLEKKSDGLWYPIPYKRAVDKTSQGLREKERENDGKSASSKAKASLPEGFSGNRTGGFNLSDLADVAIAHANRTEGGLPHLKGATGKRPATSSSSSPKKRQKQSDSLVLDDTPLPPSLEPRQSSMARLLGQTQLFKNQSTATASTNDSGSSYPTKLNNLQPHKKSASSTPPDGLYGAPPPPTPGMFASVSGFFTGGNKSTADNTSAKGTPADADTAPAPPLSRLTSQVSDWLTSFFPLQTKGATSVDPPPASERTASKVDNDGFVINPFGDEADMHDDPVFSYQPQLPDIIRRQIKIPQPMNVATDGPVITTLPPPLKGASSRGSKRKGGTNLPDLPYGASVPETAVPPAAAAAPPPAQLESGVSTTLLKLASTPSALFAGLTSFFDRSETTAADVNTQPPAGAMAARRGSKSRSSLLDDYEPTPMEARVRTVHGR